MESLLLVVLVVLVAGLIGIRLQAPAPEQPRRKAGTTPQRKRAASYDDELRELLDEVSDVAADRAPHVTPVANPRRMLQAVEESQPINEVGGPDTQRL